MKLFTFLLSCLLILPFGSVYAQIDSLILLNDDVIVGEVKKMDKGILIIETDYSDADFTIEWKGIKEIYSVSEFLITTSEGARYNGPLQSTGPRQVNMITEEDGIIAIDMENIVFLNSIDEGFLSRLYANVDLSFSFTKAQNLRQFQIRSNVGYLAERWLAEANFNRLNSTQDDVEPLQRSDGGVSFRYFLPKDWYTVTSLSFLSNTEQKLDLRTIAQLGMGKYVLHTNHTYWGFSAGVSFNNENFSTADADRQSLEGFFGTELNMYDIGDLNLLTKVVTYPSFTESGRWRVDFVFDTKYDLPLDFYIKGGVTLNYDNRPVESASETDYVFQVGFGWEW